MKALLLSDSELDRLIEALGGLPQPLSGTLLGVLHRAGELRRMNTALMCPVCRRRRRVVMGATCME